MGGEGGADNRTAWGTNHDANKGGNSARGAPQETGIRAGGGTNASPDGSAEHKADQCMLTAFGARGRRDADDGFAFYRNVGAVSLSVSDSSVTATNFPACCFKLDSITSIPWPAFKRFRLDQEPCCV